VIFDLLTKPNITLTQQEAAEVKKVAKSLLEKLKQEKLVLDCPYRPPSGPSCAVRRTPGASKR